MILSFGLTLVLSCTKYSDRIVPGSERSQEQRLREWIYWDTRMFAYHYLNEGDAVRVRDSIVFTYPIVGAAPEISSFKSNVLSPLALEAFKYVYFLWRMEPAIWKGEWFVFAVTFTNGNHQVTHRFNYELLPPFFVIPTSYYRP